MEPQLNNLPEKLTIPTKALDELLNFHSSKTVGKVLKRLEISDNKEVIKTQIKEILYESHRDLRDLLIALNYGLEISIFNLNNK